MNFPLSFQSMTMGFFVNVPSRVINLLTKPSWDRSGRLLALGLLRLATSRQNQQAKEVFLERTFSKSRSSLLGSIHAMKDIYPSRNSPLWPAKIMVFFRPYFKSFIDQAFSVNVAGYCSCYFLCKCAKLWRTWPISSHVERTGLRVLDNLCVLPWSRQNETCIPIKTEIVGVLYFFYFSFFLLSLGQRIRQWSNSSSSCFASERLVITQL